MSIVEQEGTLKYVDPETKAETLMYPNVKTDDTLSVEGKAADAKAVGTVVVGKEEKGIWISQAEYDALSEEEKMLEVDYYIYDAASSPNDIRWISQAEYDALSEEEKMLEIPYYIYDADSETNAYAVPFSAEGYEATNVGDALVEVKNAIGSGSGSSDLAGLEVIMSDITDGNNHAYDLTKYKQIMFRVVFPNGSYADLIEDVKMIQFLSDKTGGTLRTVSNSMAESGSYYAKVQIYMASSWCQMMHVNKGGSIGNVSYTVYGIY